MVAFPNDNGAATAVQAESDGSARFLTVIANAEAPTNYRFAVEVPGGGRVELSSDGGAVVLDSSGQLVTTVPAPWAKDSDDRAVPTHFETDGQSLTQVVGHPGGGFRYPITADPRFSWGWTGVTIHLNATETGYLAKGAAAALGARIGGMYAAAAFTVGGEWLADQARSRGLCVAIWKSYVGPWVSVYIERC